MDGIGVVIFAIFFGIILPSVDTGTDIRLGVRLLFNGHPRWALCVLSPVILNTLLTLIACKIFEKKKWKPYSTLVLLQIYPQFCVVRIMYRFFKGKIENARDYVRENESLDGGLGCLEPYLESVPQAYIQTAFFFIANSLNSTVERLCFNEKAHSCGEHDVCSGFNKCSTIGFDNNNCNPIGYEPYRYKTDDERAECISKTENCTLELEKCIQPFMSCLQACQTNLTEEIIQIDETSLYYTYAFGNTDWENNTWVLNNDASKEDLKRIQLFLLFIGDRFVFLSTYAVSIFASAYGITKFFRLSHSRFTKGFLSGTYIVTFLITLIFLVGKGYALAVLVLVHNRTLLESTGWWVLFAMGPSFILAFLLLFWETCFVKCCVCPKNYAVNMVFKQPPLLMAPCVTPFTYSLKSTTDKSVPKISNRGKLMQNVSIKGTFQVSRNATIVNCILTIVSTSAGVIWKGKQDMATIFMVAFPAIPILPVALWFIFKKIKRSDGLKDCIKHNKDDCDDCLKLYGFYVKKYRCYEVCEPHKNKLPCKDCIRARKNEA